MAGYVLDLMSTACVYAYVYVYVYVYVYAVLYAQWGWGGVVRDWASKERKSPNYWLLRNMSYHKHKYVCDY